MKQTFVITILTSFFISSCGIKDYEDLTNNYDKNATEILELKSYYDDLVPEGYLVRIRFNSSSEIDLEVYQPTKDSTKRELLFRQWKVNLKNYEPEENRSEYDQKYHGITNSIEKVKGELSWTTETFTELYRKLESINCIGITNRHPTYTKRPSEIEFGYKGMGVFSYLIFDQNLTPEQQEEYSDDCTMLFYKNNIVLQYGSGASGGLCTPAFDRNNKTST